jgi:SAM-dependent methyltransferase
MNQMSQNYWEARYQSGEMSWEKGAPSPGLVDFLAAHPGFGGGDALVAPASVLKLRQEVRTAATEASRPHWTVCVPGCGTGHDVRAWVQAGFDAFGCDIAPSAIRLATERTKAAGLNAKYQLADFLRDEPPFQFDWIFEHTLFCAINPGERDDYVRAIRRWLKPDGQYLAVNYLIIEDAEGPPFPVTRDELERRFSPHFELMKDWIPRSYPTRTGRERMFWWRGTTQKPVEKQ